MARIRQVDAAAELGISQPALSRRLAGEIAWRDGEIDKIAALCGVDLNEVAPMSDPDKINGNDPDIPSKPKPHPLPPPPKPKVAG